jgi:hypothetical protein
MKTEEMFEMTFLTPQKKKHPILLYVLVDRKPYNQMPNL